VPAKAKRRSLSGVERAKILKDLDRLPHGERGAYLRQLGLYSGQVSNWRKKQLEGLSANRGPKPQKSEALERRLAELERENRQLKSKLKRAELVNELQKKIAEVLGDSTGSPPEGDAEG
jgi:transposase-like protein